MLHIKNLSVNYGHVVALTDVNIHVPQGKIVSIVGANGAGKTSLLNAISGVIRKKGEAVFQGKPLPSAPHNIVRAGVVHVPEGRKIFAGLSVEENLVMGSLTGLKGMREKEETVYTLFPRLKERRSQHGGTLSGGEQQMLAIARAMMSDPKLIMLDEPSMGLAPVIVKQVLKFIREINERGITVLLVEQNARQAMALSYYTYVLENGRVMAEGLSKDLLQDPAIQKAYLGE